MSFVEGSDFELKFEKRWQSDGCPNGVWLFRRREDAAGEIAHFMLVVGNTQIGEDLSPGEWQDAPQETKDDTLEKRQSNHWERVVGEGEVPERYGNDLREN